VEKFINTDSYIFLSMKTPNSTVHDDCQDGSAA